MPMIDLTLPEGALDNEQKQELVSQLVATVKKWEGMADNPRVASTIRSFIDERPAAHLAVGGEVHEGTVGKLWRTSAQMVARQGHRQIR